ncbi:LexA family transcriptional regulator [Kosakonia radicincitans]|uniref:LexA family protein n=1 Tax=Kosakonia radicincitans TaxID=283686 RepID=UPI0031D8E8A0
MKKLTDRQQQVFAALVDFQQQHGYPPTNKELAALIGAASVNSATAHLRALEKKEVITITPHVSRGIRINTSNLSAPMAEAEEIIRALIGGGPHAVEMAQRWLDERRAGA